MRYNCSCASVDGIASKMFGCGCNAGNVALITLLLVTGAVFPMYQLTFLSF
jgi:hypothetical protein